MKALRLQLPGQFLKHVGFSSILELVEWVEILQAFQYDQTHMFSIQRMKFKEEIQTDIEDFIRAKFNPEFFKLLNMKGREITCIMNQIQSSGFFPIIDSGPWAFRFPIFVSEEKILLSLISQDEYLPKLHEILTSFTDSYDILSSTDLEKIEDIKKFFGKYFMPFPNFTSKQREIASFATKHGYFRSPKLISAYKIAKEFNISVSAVNKHLNNLKNTAVQYFFGTD